MCLKITRSLVLHHAQMGLIDPFEAIFFFAQLPINFRNKHYIQEFNCNIFVVAKQTFFSSFEKGGTYRSQICINRSFHIIIVYCIDHIYSFDLVDSMDVVFVYMNLYKCQLQTNIFQTIYFGINLSLFMIISFHYFIGSLKNLVFANNNSLEFGQK